MLYLALLIILSFMISWTKNVFMCLMYGILLYINATCVLLMIGYEFMAIINILVYVGALAVLFLFVIMLIEIPTTELNAYKRGKSVLGLLSYFGIMVLSFCSFKQSSINNIAKDSMAVNDSAIQNSYNSVSSSDQDNPGLINNVWNNMSVSEPLSMNTTQESIMQIGYAFYLQYTDILILNSLVLTIALIGALVLAHSRS